MLNGSSNLGRFQVCVEGSWEMICATNWDDDDATVVCRQLSRNESGELQTWLTLYSFHASPHCSYWDSY